MQNQMLEDYFTQDDHLFIDEMNERFPEKDMQFKFNMFLMLMPETRILQARDMRKSIIRTGWHRRGIPYSDTETLDEHVEGMIAMAKQNIVGHPMLQDVLETIESHDDGEVIIGDFDKEDKKKISKSEKHRLEYLAMTLIYETKPEMIKRWMGFEERAGFVGKYAADIDAAQMCERRLSYAQSHPQIDLSEFDYYFENLEWHTDEGKAIYQKMICK